MGRCCQRADAICCVLRATGTTANFDSPLGSSVLIVLDSSRRWRLPGPDTRCGCPAGWNLAPCCPRLKGRQEPQVRAGEDARAQAAEHQGNSGSNSPWRSSNVMDSCIFCNQRRLRPVRWGMNLTVDALLFPLRLTMSLPVALINEVKISIRSGQLWRFACWTVAYGNTLVAQTFSSC